MVFTSSRTDLRCERMALASAAESSRRSCRSRCSLMRDAASEMSNSEFSTTCHTRSRCLRTSVRSSSMASSRSRATPVHLLFHHAHQVPYVAPGENVLPNLVDHQLLEPLGVEARRLAGSPPLLYQVVTHVVGVLAALGLVGSQGLTPLTRPLRR